MHGRGKIMMAMLAALALVALVRHPTADIKIMTHDAGDPAPHQMQAAIDMGLFAIKLLVTWTAGHLAPR